MYKFSICKNELINFDFLCIIISVNSFNEKSRDEDLDQFGFVDFWLPDPVLFSLDPDPTSNNGYMKLF